MEMHVLMMGHECVSLLFIFVSFLYHSLLWGPVFSSSFTFTLLSDLTIIVLLLDWLLFGWMGALLGFVLGTGLGLGLLWTRNLLDGHGTWMDIWKDRICVLFCIYHSATY